MKVLEIIEDCVCRDRTSTHGEAEDNFADIAAIWNILFRDKLRVPFESLEVAEAMIVVKLTRMRKSLRNIENWVDAGGYATCGGGIVLREQNNAEANNGV